jgi:hypothetical protein
MSERYNKPSASQMWRLSNCSASHQAALAADTSQDTADADIGTEIHRAVENRDLTQLEPEHAEIAERCIVQAERIKASWSDGGEITEHKELRLYLCADGTVKEQPQRPVFSGQLDYLIVQGQRALIIDYKTLYGDHAPAEINDQLRAQAVLVYMWTGITDITTAIVQPAKGKPTTAFCNAEFLDAAKSWLVDVLEREINAAPNDVNAGAWCRYCPAKLTCPAFQSTALVGHNHHVDARIARLDDATSRAAIFAKATELTDEDLASHMETAKTAKWYVEAVKWEAMKRAEESPTFQRLYRIEEGTARESITDGSKVWERLAELGVSPAAFAAACKPSKTAVKALVKDATQLKGKALDDELKAVIDGATKKGNPPKTLIKITPELT